MTKSFLISSAGERDLDGIMELALKLSEEIDRKAQAEIRIIKKNVRKLFKNPDAHFIVARSSNKITGFVNFTVRKTILHSSRSALIDELIVSEKFRGKGVGKGLLSEVVKRCRDLGCCELEVSTLMSNQTARDFYRKCGFEEEAVLLEMNLSSSAAPWPPLQTV